MKKIGIVFALALLLCALCSCGKTAVEPTEPATVATEAAPTEIPTEVPTEAPTEPLATDVARELIREGKYEEALVILENEQGEEAELLRLRAGLGEVTAGSEIIFGHFEQDNILDNGSEQISWIVLEVKEDKALLLSRDCLDTQPYYDVFDGRTTWAGSTLRTWLNEDFMGAAFTETEQKLILETELVNKDNPSHHTPGGENTLDRVFLLSLDDAYAHQGEQLMISAVTPYAAARGCYVSPIKSGWWWLRSPGVYSRDASYVNSTGGVSDYGYIIHRIGWAVRPATWIDLSV